MPTFRKMSSDLLQEAAAFFMAVAEQNPAIAPNMQENAEVYKEAAQYVLDDPKQKIGEQYACDIACNLLNEAANFFSHVGDQNPGIDEQMKQNAEIYKEMAVIISEQPLGQIDD